MSESTVETTTNGPSLENILWAAAERWNDTPGLVDRDEFANYIFDAWGADSPTEEFVARFFDGDPTIARPSDMAEAIQRASNRTMHVYNFDLHRLEYVVIEDDDQVVLVSEQGQFALPTDDFLMRTIERAVIPGTKDPIGTNTTFDRKTDGTPRAYFVRKSGEIVAVDVNKLSRTVQQMQLDLKPVFSPVIGNAEDRLMPFNPTRTAMMPNREADLLRQDTRISTWMESAPRKRLVSPIDAAAASTLAAPATADAAVLLLLPDGTLARPVIGSGSRWRDMVSDWTARAAMLSIDAVAQPDAVMDDRRYTVQTDRVMAVFTGVRPSVDSSDAPGDLGFTSQTRGEAIAAARMLQANIRVLGDDDLAEAILGGATLVSSLAAPIMADTQAGTGFWLQPELFFNPSDADQQYATREQSLRSDGYAGAQLDTQLAQPQGVGSVQGATSDPWSNWALQSGGELEPGSIATALIGRDVDGGTVGGVVDPSALALMARSSRNLNSVADLSGDPVRMPSERVVAFQSPDGELVFQPQANTQVRLASVHRSVGEADDFSSDFSGGESSDSSLSAPAPRRFSASIAMRSGALPATTLSALATALDMTASASSYKLPSIVNIESADDAIPQGEAMSTWLPQYAAARSNVMLTESPFLSGSVGRMVLSMPFPSTSEIVVGRDLDEALSAWMTAPAISVGDATSALSGGSGTTSSSWGNAAMVSGAAGGAIAGGLALRGDSSYSGGPIYSGSPALSNAAMVSGGSPNTGLSSVSGADFSGSSVPSSGGTFDASRAVGMGAVAGSSLPGSALPGGVLSSNNGGVSNFGNPNVGTATLVSGSPGPSYSVVGGAAGQGLPAAIAMEGGLGAGDIGSLHGAAMGHAQRAAIALQIPAAANTLSSRATLAGLPKLLARALESSGGWLPGAGTPLPQTVREFALSGPFDLPELATIGNISELQDDTGFISRRVLNPGEEEISIPMPLWTQMGRGRLSSTDAVMASPRMRPGFAPPLGIYKLVQPETVDFTAGAPESTPGIVTLQGPTELGLDRSLAGGVEANKLGGQFVLGKIPLADGETVVSRRGRIRIGAPLSADELSGGSQDSASSDLRSSSALAQSSSFASAGEGAMPSTSAVSNELATARALGSDAPTGELVSSDQLKGLSVPSMPQVEMPGDLEAASLAPSSSGRPFAGALQSALKFSDDVGGRVGSSVSSPAQLASVQSVQSFSGGPNWGNVGQLPSSREIVSGQPMLGSGGGGIASGVNTGGEFGGASRSLASSAPQGSFVSGGASSGGSALSSAAGAGESGGSGAMSSLAQATSGSDGMSGTVAGLPPGAWSGARRDDGGYTPWIYGSRFSPNEQSVGGVDMISGARLGRPTYPSLPAALRFRYIGAPLWWTASTGSWGQRGGDDTNESTGSGDGMVRSLRSGLSAANSAATIWRSIFVSPGNQEGPGSGSGSRSTTSDAGSMDQTWDSNADSMASLSSRMSLIAVGMGGSAAAAATGTGALQGPETVYVAMDSAGRAGTLSGGQRDTAPSELQMRIVAAIPPSPPPIADMSSTTSNKVEARPRSTKAGGHGHGDEQKGGEDGVSRSKIEGSVDAIAQRIYHRIVRRLEADRERFGA